MNTQFGAGVFVMTFKTALEIEIANMDDALSRADGSLRKLLSPSLRKGGSQSIGVELRQLAGALDDAIAVAKRRREALPSFRKWALGSLADRAGGGSMIVADKTGTTTALSKQQQPAVDLNQAARETMIHRDRHQHED